MRHWKKLLGFLLFHLMLAETTNPPCSNEECYILLNKDLDNTRQQTISITNSLEEIRSLLLTTMERLDEATETVNDTLLYAKELNTSEAELIDIFTSVTAELVSSQQQINGLFSLITSISTNATAVATISNNAAATVNQTISNINMAIETLDQLETSLLPMVEDVAALIHEQTDNGTGLHEELMMRLRLITSQAADLFNSSFRGLSIINATIESLTNSSILQENISAGTLAQMAVSQGISDKLDALSDDLLFIRRSTRFFTNYISIQNIDPPPTLPMDQINQQLSEAIQLTIDLRSLLGNISMLNDLRINLYTLLSSYEARYYVLSGQIQMLEQEALRLYNGSVLLNENANSTSQEASQLVAEAQHLWMVLQNFSGFVDTANELLQSIETIQMSAINTIDAASNVSDMIAETYQVVNDSLLVLMESSDLSQTIDTTLNSWSAEVIDAVQTTQNLSVIESSRTSLENVQMAIDNITIDFISQQEYINNTEAEVDRATQTIQNAENNCDNASASVEELQSILDNIGYLSYEEIAEVRNRMTTVELSIAELQNMAAALRNEMTRQREMINTLENEITDIEIETETLTQLYNSLPQSCDEMI